MTQLDIVAVMERLRDKGWLVALKVIPKEAGYIIEGSRSEYDAPCADREVCKGKWCCEISDVAWVKSGGETYRNPVFSFGQTAQEAMANLLINLQRDEDFRTRRNNAKGETK